MKRLNSQTLDRHLRLVLGDPFDVMREHGLSGVNVYGYLDVPAIDEVSLMSTGLSSYARKNGFARTDGYAQELVLTVAKRYFGDPVLQVFTGSLRAFVKQRQLVEWDVPIRLSKAMPGSDDMRFVLPSPAATFDEEFSFCEERTGLTQFCLMIPLHEDEANWVIEFGPSLLYQVFEDREIFTADLQRESIGPDLLARSDDHRHET